MSKTRLSKSVTLRFGPLLAGFIPVLCLLPFVAKAFHIDDTVYLAVAEQIQHRPWDFFGFQMNWMREPQWVYDFNKNPPGISYYIAIVAALFGRSEVTLHLSFLVPTFVAGVGVYRLAERFCDRPLAAALLGTLTPAFLVSNSNLMCEPFVAAFYVWAVVYWVRGLDNDSTRSWVVSATLIGVGTLMKYIVITALPLLAAYTLLRKRRFNRAFFYLVISIAPLFFYALYTLYLYDTGILASAIGFAADHTLSGGKPAALKLYIALAFLGGCFLPVLLVCLFTNSVRRNSALAAAFVIVTVLLIGSGGIDDAYHMYSGSNIRWLYLLELSLFITAGLNILFVTTRDAAIRRNADSALLVFWVIGIFVFSGFVNWTINARALMVMAPALGILVVRQLPQSLPAWRTTAPIVLGALIAMAVLSMDFAYANAGRAAAAESVARLNEPSGGRWFQGHWGFQHYMEQAGYQHVSMANVTETTDQSSGGLGVLGFAVGDVCVVKMDDRLVELDRDDCRKLFTLSLNTTSWGATMNQAAGAAFYDDYFGELPYYFGPVAPVTFAVYEVLRVE